MEGRWDFRPQWSPSGTALAFTRVPSVGAASELWLMDADGSNQRCLTKGPRGDSSKGVDHARWLAYGYPSPAAGARM